MMSMFNNNEMENTRYKKKRKIKSTFGSNANNNGSERSNRPGRGKNNRNGSEQRSNRPAGKQTNHRRPARQGSGRKKSTLDPTLLIRRASGEKTKEYVSERL